MSISGHDYKFIHSRAMFIYQSGTVFLTCLFIFSHAQVHDELQREMRNLKETLKSVSRQVMLQQFFTEEKIRSDGFSGIKQIRTREGRLN